MLISKIAGLFVNKSAHRTGNVPQLIYGDVMAQARISVLYSEYGVPDTVMGRSDMLALHVFMLGNRLKNASPSNSEKCTILSQQVFDLFVIDLERGLRDIGFADTSVHKRKKKLVHSYYGLIDEFDPLLTSRNVVRLSQGVANRFLSDVHEPQLTTGAMMIANYLLATYKSLKAQSDEELLDGKINWQNISEEHP